MYPPCNVILLENLFQSILQQQFSAAQWWSILLVIGGSEVRILMGDSDCLLCPTVVTNEFHLNVLTRLALFLPLFSLSPENNLPQQKKILAVHSSPVYYDHLAPVFRREYNAIQRINLYPWDSVVCVVNVFPFDSDLSDG